MSLSPRPQSPYTNHLGQPVGEPLPDWSARSRPSRTVMEGRRCRLEPLQASLHADALYEAHALDAEGRNWTYLPYGPFASPEDLARWIESVESSEDPPVLRHHRPLDAAARRLGELPAHRPDDGHDRGRSSRLLACTATHAGGHRSDVPDDAAGLRRAWLPALRVEVQFPERAFLERRRAAGVPLRRHFSPGGRAQRPQ